MATEKKHRWKFNRVGGVDQVTLRDGADLTHLPELDPKLWVALAMPTRGVHVDTKTLDALDTDKDGRIRLPEVLDAVKWAAASLKSADELLKSSDRLLLETIADADLRASAKRILANLGKGDATEITVEDLADTTKIFAETRFNGDGVVPVESGDDEGTRQLLTDIIETHGAVPDRSGKPGVNAEKAAAFFAEIEALAAWQRKAEASVLTLGAATAAAADATLAVRAKIDDFFTRCRIAAVDARAAAALSGSDEELASLSKKDLSSASEVGELPLARIEANRTLPLDGRVNPAWADAIQTFATAAVKPAASGARDALSFDEWVALKAKLAPYEAWRAEKPVTAVEKLGLERVKLIAESTGRETVAALIGQDLAVEGENSRIASVEKLLLCKRDLFLLLNNFVNFSDFYARRGAVFQAGTLFLDGRGCSLCMEVGDATKHGTLAGLAGAYLAYCDCTRPGGEKLSIVAAFTDGDSDNLLVGRNGVFFDRRGRDWDATITKLVANPISLREAFWSPYKKLVRLIEGQFAKRAEKADAEAHAHLTKTAEAVGTADKEKPAPKAPEPSKIDIGTVAAIGVAVGGIGAMVTGVLSTFFGLGLWMPMGLLALMLLISGPAVLLAFLKLRQRNLGPLLDANGWAINGRARINVPFGGALTDVAKLPKGAERSLKDPYEEKGHPWRLYMFLLVLVAVGFAWYIGRLDRYLPRSIRVEKVLGRAAFVAPGEPPSVDTKPPTK
ncbi:MAG: hypothetical protein ACXVCV_08855 [Polyangia bacterium]